MQKSGTPAARKYLTEAKVVKSKTHEEELLGQ